MRPDKGEKKVKKFVCNPWLYPAATVEAETPEAAKEAYFDRLREIGCDADYIERLRQWSEQRRFTVKEVTDEE